jgi:hypothetical protein
MPYRIYVKQKSGETVSGIEIHHGPLPKTGDKVDVKLQSGRIIQARVGIPHTRACAAAANGASSEASTCYRVVASLNDLRR